MGIYGAGSKWDKDELKNDFFQNDKFNYWLGRKTCKRFI